MPEQDGYAGLVRSPLDEIAAIRTLLADVYKDAGDGRTLVRELVQNADDAGATQLTLAVLDGGFPEARNSLLRGPALLVVNNGAFFPRDREGIHRAIGGTKEEEAAKIGTFGIGLKSAFHICEAFAYLGAREGAVIRGVLNPWAGTGRGPNDPVHPDWDNVDQDQERLQSVAAALLGEPSANFLLIWIPLRALRHLDRSIEGTYGLGQRCPPVGEVAKWFQGNSTWAVLLAQCGTLGEIRAVRASSAADLVARQTSELTRADRSAAGRWVGRLSHDDRSGTRDLYGDIRAGETKWTVAGRESFGHGGLRELRSHQDWPSLPRWVDGRFSSVPRKGLAHAAVSVLRPVEVQDHLGVRLRWAVFLPLDDDPAPRTQSVVECLGPLPAWEIVLHGYFWPSQDRRSIPGVTDDVDESATDMRVRWNRGIRDEMLLPLLPEALARAVRGVEEGVSRRLIGFVVQSSVVQRQQQNAVTKRAWLLPIMCEHGLVWESFAAANLCVLSIPGWRDALEGVRERLSLAMQHASANAVLIDEDAPRLAGRLSDWSEEHFRILLTSIGNDGFRSAKDVQWIERAIRHVVGGDEDSNALTGTAARWLATRVAEGALSRTMVRVDSDTGREAREELREAWVRLLNVLPRDWLVDAPLESQQAVRELAGRQLIGEGLMPVPFGTGRHGGGAASTPQPHDDQVRVDKALRVLGDWLAEDGTSGRLRRSRSVLAETLLAVRDGLPDGVLASLPLVRVYRMADSSEDVWSIDRLVRAAASHRVFASPSGAEEGDGSRPSDPRRGTKELADALGEDVWFVTAWHVAAATKTPAADVDEFANAVLGAEDFAGIDRRRALTERLAGALDESRMARSAIRTLLVGQRIPSAATEVELLSPTSEREGRSAAILLGILGEPWRLVAGQLLRVFTEEATEILGVRRASQSEFQDLVRRAVDDETNPWNLTSDDARHLLGHLYVALGDQLDLWKGLPLHRFEDGTRGALTPNVWRAGAGSPRLPQDLRTELRILDPDPGVASLYATTPVLDEEGLPQAMLLSTEPHRFAERIVDALPRSDGHLSVSTERSRALLKDRPWLPNADGGGIAPKELLLVPPELLADLDELGPSGALGATIQSAVEPGVWASAEPVVRDILNRPSRVLQIRQILESLRRERLAVCDAGAWLIAGDTDRVNATFVYDCLQTPLCDVHRGWRLLRKVNSLVLERKTESGGVRAADLVVEFAARLCGPVPANQQLAILRGLAESRPPKDSAGGRAFRELVGCFAASGLFVRDVLPELDLPTQDGHWRPASMVARTEGGVARRHRVIEELRRPLLLDGAGGSAPVQVAHGVGGQAIEDTLETYFEQWRDRVPHGAVGAFISLLGDGLRGSLLRLAEEWCGDDISVEGVRADLVGDSAAALNGLSVWISPRVSDGERVVAENLLGAGTEMAADEENDTLLAVDPVRVAASRYSALAPLGPFWELRLREVQPKERTTQELLALLGATVERWAVGFLNLERESVRESWSQWGRTSQADVGPVRASIMAKLPLTLHQLGVRECDPLRVALRQAEIAQRKREQMRSQDAMDEERHTLVRLAELIQTPPIGMFLAGRVRSLIERYGYSADSVLLELAQNADDALEQAVEMRGGGLPTAACRLEVRVFTENDAPTLDVTHWGRPINETGGSAFPAGRDREWDQDLYYMMLMNLSSKPGEALASGSAATTGRFGLGFKSVHLVSSRPSVVSRFVSFSIAGGLLPEELPIADDQGLVDRGGQKPTRVRLPLRSEVAQDMTVLFRRFDYAAFLIPVFARQLRRVVVDGGPSPTSQVFDGTGVRGARGWSFGSEVRMPGHDGRWRIARFRPADTGLGTGTAALAFGIQDGIPSAFPLDFPFLWHIAPTSESWGCGYAVNGPWKLDPGRTHVSVDGQASLAIAGELGAALGQGLIDLHDELSDPDGELRGLLGVDDSKRFLGSLWKLLADGIYKTDDPLRREFLRQLHGNESGISRWMRTRSIVPSGLGAPFPSVLPAMDAEMKVEVAGDLAEPDLCGALNAIDDPTLASVLAGRCVVSREVANLLRPLLGSGGPVRMNELNLDDALGELAEGWGRQLTPERLQALRPLAREGVWDSVTGRSRGARWRSGLEARAADGTSQQLQGLLLGTPPSGWEPEDEDAKDELRRAAIAPPDNVLARSYIQCAEDWKVFRWLRERHRVDAASVAEWYPALPDALHGPAIHYLVHGNLAKDVLKHLMRSKRRPVWLRTYETVRQILDELDEEAWQKERLLGSLFHDRFAPVPPTEPPVTDDGFFERLTTWWDTDAERLPVIDAYEREAWPRWLREGDVAASLRDGSPDHWLALLVLGACRGIGRTRDTQHRSFLERARQNGWWDVFRSPDEPERWMAMLREWQDEARERLTYSTWMALFPAVYQFSRYLDVYRRLLQSAGRRDADQFRVTSLLAPRIDEALSGAGSGFDAPPAPLHMGLHWALRELVRLRVIDGEHLYADCWVPSRQVVGFLERYGLLIEDTLLNSDKARSVADFMAQKTGQAAPHLHRAFDIPIRHVATHEDCPVWAK